MASTRALARDAAHLAVLLALLFVLLYLLTWTHTLKCSALPGWCSVYYALRGPPRVAIVSGAEGLGEPELLARLLANPHGAGAHADQLGLQAITPGNLKRYDLVIVERARKMSSEQVKMFLDYANTGGVLVWTGDAGAEPLNEDELLYEDEDTPGAPHRPISPWARKLRNKKVLLNERLGVDYLANYCSVRPCSPDRPTCAAVLEPQDTDHPLTFALRGGLKLCVFEGQDFALVRPATGGRATTLLSADFGARLTGQDRDFGNPLPVVLVTAASTVLGVPVGEKVAYYAIPPELLANPRLPEDQRYPSLVENLYYGMLYG